MDDYKNVLNYSNYRKVTLNADNAESLFSGICADIERVPLVADSVNQNVTAEHSRGKIKTPFKFLLPCTYKNTTFISLVLGIPMSTVDGIIQGRLYVKVFKGSNAFLGNWVTGEVKQLFNKPTSNDKVLLYGDAFEYMLKKIHPEKTLQLLRAEKNKWSLNYKKTYLQSRIAVYEFIVENNLVLTNFITNKIVVIPAVYNTLFFNLTKNNYSKLLFLYLNAVNEFKRYNDRKDKNIYSKLNQFKANKVILYTEYVFEWFDQNGITFKSKVPIVNDLLKQIFNFDFQICDVKDATKITLPIKFERWDKPLEIYVYEKSEKFILSDGGYLFEYLDEFTDYDYIKDENKFNDFCQKNLVIFNNKKFTTQVLKTATANEKSVIFFNFIKVLCQIAGLYELL